MRSSTWRLIALASTTAVLGTFAVVRHYQDGRSLLFLVSDFVGGAAMATAGVVIWRRRPLNRCWSLLLAASIAWWVGEFEHSTNAKVSELSFSFGSWSIFFLAWAVLAFPSGRLHRRAELVVVAAIGLVSAMRSLSRLFLHVPPDTAGFGTRNRYLPVTDDRWWRGIEDAHSWGITITALAVLAIIAQRWLASSRTTRQMLSPALFAAAVLAVGVFLQYRLGWNAAVGLGDVRVFHVVWWTYAALALALALGMVRLRRTRSEVIDVFSELGHAPPPARLEQALALALGDASLTLLRWSQDRGYVDASGTVVDLPTGDSRRAVTRIERNGEPLGALVHDAALLEDPGLVQAVAGAIRLTLDNEQLQRDLEAQLVEIAASRQRIVEAGDAERRRIERNLHDGAQQRLVTTAIGLRIAGERLADTSDPRVHAVLETATEELTGAIEELRDLARGIHPVVLTQFGLGAALESLASRSASPVELSVDVRDDLPTVVASTAYFAVSEALTNADKHAQASSIRIRATTNGDTLSIAVCDDGVGGADLRNGTGLAGIADRVATVGGTLRVVSRAGEGTRFEIELPCASS
jgi:signal transduction histidine kinase